MTDIEFAQTLQLKRSLTIAMQYLDPFFFGNYDLKSIKAPVITLGDKSGFGYLYEVMLKMEQKALKLYQDRVEEARLDCLLMEIVEQKKEAATCPTQSELNLQKEKEAVETFSAIINQT